MKYAIQHIPSGQYLFIQKGAYKYKPGCLIYSEEEIPEYFVCPNTETVLLTLDSESELEKLCRFHTEYDKFVIHGNHKSLTYDSHEFVAVPFLEEPV